MSHVRLPAEESARALRRHLIAIYKQVLAVSAPPENVIGGFLRMNPEIRGGARGFLASVCFHLLRYRVRTRIHRLAGEHPFEYQRFCTAIDEVNPAEEARDGVARWLCEDLGATDSEIDAAAEDLGLVDHVAFFRRPLPPLPSVVDLARRYSLRPELADRWQIRFGEDLPLLATSVTTPAPLDLWFENLSAMHRAAEVLQASGIASRPAPMTASGLRLESKRGIKAVEGMKALRWTVQDAGSQLVAEALAPMPSGARILDLCAGAGGKTINLAARFSGCQIVAADAIPERLAVAQKRLEKFEFNNISYAFTELPSDLSFDAILIDAPCSGLGTLARDPSLQWRRPLAESIAIATTAQRDCLRAAAKALKPQGVLVYATCSVEPEETTGHESELSALGFQPDAISEEFADRLPGGAKPRPHIVLLPPGLFATDGFFIARYRKSQDPAP